LWGYSRAGLSPRTYEKLLEVAEVKISPLTVLNTEEAAKMKPKSGDLLDALTAASVKRLDATVWTSDRDFLRFLPEANVKIV
jgi:predicted nucleic acid-binding protein